MRKNAGCFQRPETEAPEDPPPCLCVPGAWNYEHHAPTGSHVTGHDVTCWPGTDMRHPAQPPEPSQQNPGADSVPPVGPSLLWASKTGDSGTPLAWGEGGGGLDGHCTPGGRKKGEFYTLQGCPDMLGRTQNIQVSMKCHTCLQTQFKKLYTRMSIFTLAMWPLLNLIGLKTKYNNSLFVNKDPYTGVLALGVESIVAAFLNCSTFTQTSRLGKFMSVSEYVQTLYSCKAL